MLIYILHEIGETVLFFKDIIFNLLKVKYRYICQQLYHIGVETLPIVGIMAIFTGMVIAVNTYYQFKIVNLENFTGTVVALSMAIELGPVLTAIITAARVGTATAAQISTMKLTSQIDALRILAVSPIRYLVVPRFISAVIMLPILTIYADFIGIVGGYLMGVIKFGINHHIYIKNSLYLLDSYDILAGLIKTVFFAMVIITISSRSGLCAESSVEGVKRATTQAVVISSVCILISNYFLSLILF